MARRTKDDPTAPKGSIPQAEIPPMLEMGAEEYQSCFDFTANDMERAVFAVFTTNSLPEAARRSGLTLPRLKKWLDDPRFQEAVRELRNQLLARAFEGMLSLFTEASKSMLGILRDGTAAQKIDAARLVYEHCHLSNMALRDMAESEALLRVEPNEFAEEAEDGE